MDATLAFIPHLKEGAFPLDTGNTARLAHYIPWVGWHRNTQKIPPSHLHALALKPLARVFLRISPAGALEGGFEHALTRYFFRQAKLKAGGGSALFPLTAGNLEKTILKSTRGRGGEGSERGVGGEGLSLAHQKRKEA